MHDGAGLEPDQRRGHRFERARPGHPEDVVAVDDLAEQPGRDSAKRGAQLHEVLLGGVDDETAPKLEVGGEPDREVEIDLALVVQLDPHQAAAAGLVEDARDLEATEAELLRDLALRGALDVVAAGDGRCQNRSRRPLSHGGRGRATSPRTRAHLSDYILHALT